MEDYKPNSNRYKAEMAAKAKEESPAERHVEKVVTGTVKKRGGLTKIKNSFFKEDMHNIGDYILNDVLIPSFKKAVSEIVSNGVDMMLYGEVKSKKRDRSPASRVSYRDYYDRDRDDDYRSRRRSSSLDFEEYEFNSRGDAEMVLDRMEEILDRYQIVTVGDFYDLVGEVGNYTDNKFGWSDLRTARVARTRSGYVIKLPRPMPID